jgi:hypothetical protein
VILEEQRDAPDRRNSDKGVDHAGKYRALTAEDEGNKVEAEYSDQTPVYASDDKKDECYPVKHLVYLLLEIARKARAFVYIKPFSRRCTLIIGSDRGFIHSLFW